jgi:hypothetical protein
METFVSKTRNLDPVRKLRRVSRAANFGAALRFIHWRWHTARPALIQLRPDSFLRPESFELGLPEAVGRNDCHLTCAAPQ